MINANTTIYGGGFDQAGVFHDFDGEVTLEQIKLLAGGLSWNGPGRPLEDPNWRINYKNNRYTIISCKDAAFHARSLYICERGQELRKLKRDELLQLLVDMTGAPNLGFVKRMAYYKLINRIATMELI